MSCTIAKCCCEHQMPTQDPSITIIKMGKEGSYNAYVKIPCINYKSYMIISQLSHYGKQVHQLSQSVSTYLQFKNYPDLQVNIIYFASHSH